jgi:hypothetical protein
MQSAFHSIEWQRRDKIWLISKCDMAEQERDRGGASQGVMGG